MKSLGIPTEEEFVSLYSELTGTADLTRQWNFYMAFTFFRVAAILQGVYKRSLQSETEKERGERGREGERVEGVREGRGQERERKNTMDLYSGPVLFSSLRSVKC